MESTYICLHVVGNIWILLKDTLFESHQLARMNRKSLLPLDMNSNIGHLTHEVDTLNIVSSEVVLISI